MFTIFSKASRISAYFDREHLSVMGEDDGEHPIGVDQKGDRTPDVHRPRDGDNLKRHNNKARTVSLERTVVAETVAKSDVWPPETRALIEKQNPTSHQIVAEKDRNSSDILTHIYTRLIDHFEKQGLSQGDATTHAANFMRKYSPELQQLLALNTEPTVMREKIRDYTREYLQSVPLSADGTNIDDALHGSAKSPELFSDEDRAFNSKIVSYSSTIVVIRQYEEEHHVSPEEVIAEKLSENHLNTIVIPEADRERVLENAQIDSPASIVSGVGIGDSKKIQMLDENGISDIMCTHTQDGDYILQFPTGESILIDANGDRSKAEKEIKFIQEIAKTPIVRRILMNGNARFQHFRQNFEKQFPGMDIELNPQLFIRKVLERILSKIPDDGLNDYQRGLKDDLASLLSPDVSLSRIQEFLRNMRDQFIPMLHSTRLIPQDGVQMLSIQKLL